MRKIVHPIITIILYVLQLTQNTPINCFLTVSRNLYFHLNRILEFLWLRHVSVSTNRDNYTFFPNACTHLSELVGTE